MITKDDIKPLKRLFTAENLEDIDMVYRNPTIIECSTVADELEYIKSCLQTYSYGGIAKACIHIEKMQNILRGEK